MPNVYQRMHAVMTDVGYLKKDSFVDDDYWAISEEAVTSAVRASMIKNGLVIIPVAYTHSRQDEQLPSGMVNRITQLDATYRIQNVDDPDDYILAVSSGTGADLQDKGIGKAMTYAYKYLLLRAFAIPTGTDTDAKSSKSYTNELLNAPLTSRNNKYNPNVYGNGRTALLHMIRKLCTDDAALDNLCVRLFGRDRNIGNLTDDELHRVVDELENHTCENTDNLVSL